MQDEDTVAVVVRYSGAGGHDDAVDALLGKLRRDGPERWLLRRLQRNTVTVHKREVQEWQPGCFVQGCGVG